MALPAAIWEGRHSALAEKARERKGGWGQARGWERGWGCRGDEPSEPGASVTAAAPPFPASSAPGPARQRSGGRSREPGRPRCRTRGCRPGAAALPGHAVLRPPGRCRAAAAPLPSGGDSPPISRGDPPHPPPPRPSSLTHLRGQSLSAPPPPRPRGCRVRPPSSRMCF
ncbi:putative uncharacterized protein FRMD6-AS1 [Pseudopipra pipra]|uniref:putative uncharacterized protein FRMD6-AS1 n=1 Tax=Pseudopipra pipra TaxID=415032 RepID=UPI003138913F